MMIAALMLAALPSFVAPVIAAPTSPLRLQNSEAPVLETVQYRRGWRGGRYGGAGVGIGLGIAGALIGGAIIGATQPYGYYGYPPGYYGPAYVAPPYAGDGAVDYCLQRFQSYDPASGTYLGYDGLRHPCP
jgi:hypothetical protein